MNEKLTILFPAPMPNTYISLIESCINESGYNIVYLDNIIKNKEILKEAIIANLNWYEGIGNQNILKYIYAFLRKIKYFVILKHYHIKIIFTFHNLIPHDTKFKYMDALLIKFCLKNADRIVGLCDNTREILKRYLSDKEINEKLCIINHCSFEPIYRNIKKDEKIKNIIADDEKAFHVLFFGLLRKYKNIELVIRLAEDFKHENINFIIAGNVPEEEYKIEIADQIKQCKNITLIPRHITDEEIISLYEWADISICPLNLESSVNSGSMVMSFGFKTPVIGPKNGTIKDFPAIYNYSYQYTSEKDHYPKLKEKFVEAYNDWKDDSLKLKEKGKNLYEYLGENFSYEMTREKYSNLYNELAQEGKG